MAEPINLTQLGLYNPQRMSDDVVEKIFIVRNKLFSFILDKITSEQPNSIPQHYMLIAQRGMGKSTFLKRMEVELRKPAYSKNFIPVLYPEEQYNLTDLAEFWLNSLDALADTLETEKNVAVTAEIDTKVEELADIKDREEVGKQAHEYFKAVTKRLKRRPVLLLDNMSLIFSRMETDEQHTLRAWLTQTGAPVLLGASAVTMDAVENYGAPFYDAFQFHFLNRLTFQELLDVLNNLAKYTDAPNVRDEINRNTGRLKTIHHLTGGNPRTAVMLFRMVVKGFSAEINQDLEGLLDEITPLYKARFEELSTQMQVIVDAIALNWDPINLEQLREETNYENNQISPQLKRLVEAGWIEKLDAYKAKGHAYQISERFFNIWFLMRRSSRRQKREIYCLSKFLETFYGEEVHEIASKRVDCALENADSVTYNLALAEVVQDKSVKYKLLYQSYEALQKLAVQNPRLLDQFDFSDIKKEADKYKIYDKFKNLKPVDEVLKIALQLSPTLQKHVIEVYGRLYQDYKIYDDAEKMYKKVIEIDANYVIGYLKLAYFYSNDMQRYDEAEELYLKAISIDTNCVPAYFNLAILYSRLNRYDEAAQMYLKVISIDKNNIDTYNRLGNLYHDNLNQLENAEKMYQTAMKLNDSEVCPKLNLIFLYRDKMNKLKDAEAIFNALDTNQKEAKDSYWLNKALFELYKRNEGIAKDFMALAFEQIDDELPANTQDDWWRAGAVIVKLGYGEWWLQTMQELGLDKTLSPYFTAIRAMIEPDAEAYLNSRAVEIREPARELMEIMKKY